MKRYIIRYAMRLLSEVDWSNLSFHELEKYGIEDVYTHPITKEKFFLPL